jgi:hypothetical protein
MKVRHLNYKVILLFILIASLVAGCSSNKVGKLVGVEFSMGLSDIADGVIDEANFGGIVIVELDDGTQVRAIWDKSLGDEVTGGMKLEIAPTDDPDMWIVVKIVETP